MPYGLEAKAMLQKIVDGKPLRLRVYDVDQYGRLVADVHCERGFVQVCQRREDYWIRFAFFVGLYLLIILI